MPSIINATTSSGLVNSADNSGSLQLATNNGTTAVTIDTSQNVGIGTTSPQTKLHVTQSNDALPALQLQHGDGDFILMEEGGGTDLFKFTRVAGTNDLQINNITANNIRFATDNAERMRINSSGDLLVGTTTKSNDEKVTIYQSANAVGLSIRSNGGPVSGNYESSDNGHNAYWTFGRDNQTTGNFVFYNAGNLRGSINNATGAYTATSDARVKKNIETLQYGLQEVLSLRPVLYLMEQESDDSKKHIGFIAQEVKAVMDEAVDDLQDERTQLYGLDKSGLVPVLVKAIQEQQAQIEQLKAEVQALKGAA